METTSDKAWPVGRVYPGRHLACIFQTSANRGQEYTAEIADFRRIHTDLS